MLYQQQNTKDFHYKHLHDLYHYISNVISINVFVRLFNYLNSIWITIFNINHFIKKAIYANFNIDLFDYFHLYI